MLRTTSRSRPKPGFGRPGSTASVTALAAVVAATACAGPASAQIEIPNPFEETDPAWGDLPQGRDWGSISAVYPAPDGRSVWVADRCGAGSCVGREDVDMIFQLDLEGRVLQSFGAGLIAVPHGIHVDRDGNVWVADASYLGSTRDEPPTVGQVVRKFSSAGELLMTLGEWGVVGSGPEHFDRPTDVLVSPSGDVFVADGHEDDGNNRIVKFDENGRYLMEWGGTGEATGQFREPHALAMDSQGRLFVGDRGNQRVQIFDQDGNHLQTWTQFGSPSGVYVSPDDTLYVADSDSNASTHPGWRRGIYIGSATDGWVTGFIQDPEPNPDDLVTSAAEGVAVDAMGNLYGGEVGSRTLRRYAPR